MQNKMDTLIEALRGCARQVTCDDTVCYYSMGRDCLCVNEYLRLAADALENAQTQATSDRKTIEDLRAQLEKVTLEKNALLDDLAECNDWRDFGEDDLK